MAGKARIFVSSVQKEFADERRAIRDFVHGNRLLSRHFDVFLFEDLAAKDRRPDDLYLDEVGRCTIYVGLFGRDYGWEDPKDGLSPTEREFDRATSAAKYRLLFLKTLEKQTPHAKMAGLIERARNQLVYKRFQDISGLTAQLYESLIDFLEDRGVIQNKPFDAAPCALTGIDDIAEEKLRWFVTTARRERNMNLAVTGSTTEILTHLDMLADGRLTNAATILFGHRPQRFLPAAIIKCAHFHGVEVTKPIPSHQVFEGTLFDQVDASVDFVMARLRRSVGTRRASAAAPVGYEIAREAVAEIIVNAAAHRDYTSTASVQVAVFADRVEVSNPGRLPPGLTPQDLQKPHASEPPNPLIARPLYLAHYIESLGTGTVDVIRLCREADLPLPEFQQRGGQFVVTLWRDWLTETTLTNLGLEGRQIQAILGARATRRLTTAGYMEAASVSRATAKRDLDALATLGLLLPQGSGRGAYYEIARNRPKSGSIGS